MDFPIVELMDREAWTAAMIYQTLAETGQVLIPLIPRMDNLHRHASENQTPLHPSPRTQEKIRSRKASDFSFICESTAKRQSHREDTKAAKIRRPRRKV